MEGLADGWMDGRADETGGTDVHDRSGVVVLARVALAEGVRRLAREPPDARGCMRHSAVTSSEESAEADRKRRHQTQDKVVRGQVISTRGVIRARNLSVGMGAGRDRVAARDADPNAMPT